MADRKLSVRDRRAAELALSDLCAWCLGPMPPGEFQMLHGHVNNPAPDFLHHTVWRLLVGDRPVHGWPMDPNAGDIPAGFNITFTLCSHACRDALCAAIRADPSHGRHEDPAPPAGPVPPYTPSRDDREWAYEMVEAVCAWCGRQMEDAAHPIRVFATYRTPRQQEPPCDEPMIAITIGGRKVPGYPAQPGSSAALDGIDIGFKICGTACAEALSKAVADDNVLAVLH